MQLLAPSDLLSLGNSGGEYVAMSMDPGPVLPGNAFSDFTLPQG